MSYVKRHKIRCSKGDRKILIVIRNEKRLLKIEVSKWIYQTAHESDRT